MRRIALVAALLGGFVLFGVTPAQAAPVICEKYGSTTIQSGRYVVINNVWGANTSQCIDVNQSGGFTIQSANHNNATNGAPASYPTIYAGCHYATCSTGSNLPMQASSSAFGNVRTSVSMSYPSSGTWDAAYDIWFDPTPRTDGQNTGAEVMIWLNRQGSIQPIGSQVGTVNLAGGTWQVWFGNIGWNVISYVRTSATSSMDFAVNTFYSDAVSRGYAQRSWYLTSVQAGFEPWIGGAGLTVNNFTYSTSGGSNDTTAPSAPSNLNGGGTTSNSTNLSWSASSDNVGVAGYRIFRRQGSSGSFTQVGTSSSTSFSATGLSASTAYQFYVTAYDAAGNVSSQSNTASVTTTSGGGQTGNCTVRFDQWGGGYVAQFTLTGPASNWSLPFTLPSGHQITSNWSSQVSVSGSSVTIRGMDYNASLGSGQSTQFGFQATRPGSSGVPSIPGCTQV
ncbi:GH12 family glycosyl hydrolase domain-containing protein [Herbidospora cretacea]|uniref:GH12 family glycosyl hydrolase domain-containing protein n=1 Tax=Herbidospora cretacea TaxID=28444 RepID=UPI000772F075|nr:cellulose binding domain-containing protein [Herbidospora cretacea]